MTFDLEQFKAGRRAVTRSGSLAEFGAHRPDAPLNIQVVYWNVASEKWQVVGADGQGEYPSASFALVAMEPRTVEVKRWVIRHRSGELHTRVYKPTKDELLEGSTIIELTGTYTED